MKVICIDDSGSKATDWNPLVAGDTYTASQCKVYENNYDLVEHPSTPSGRPVSFHKDRFIPLSSIDETELVKERLTTVNQ